MYLTQLRDRLTKLASQEVKDRYDQADAARLRLRHTPSPSGLDFGTLQSWSRSLQAPFTFQDKPANSLALRTKGLPTEDHYPGAIHPENIKNRSLHKLHGWDRATVPLRSAIRPVTNPAASKGPKVAAQSPSKMPAMKSMAVTKPKSIKPAPAVKPPTISNVPRVSVPRVSPGVMPGVQTTLHQNRRLLNHPQTREEFLHSHQMPVDTASSRDSIPSLATPNSGLYPGSTPTPVNMNMMVTKNQLQPKNIMDVLSVLRQISGGLYGQ